MTFSLIKVHSKFSLPLSPPLFPLFFSSLSSHSFFTCLQWVFEMLALACMYPWQPCNHGDQPNLSHLDCLYGGWTPRLADVFNGWCSWKVFVQHHGQQCQHDTRPAIPIYTTGVKREGRRHQCVQDILLHCPSQTIVSRRKVGEGGGGLISFPHLFIQYVHCLQCNIENKGLKMKLTCKLTPPLLSEHQPRCDSYEVLQCNTFITWFIILSHLVYSMHIGDIIMLYQSKSKQLFNSYSSGIFKTY